MRTQKNQGVDIATPLPGVANEEKIPLSFSTCGLIQPVMSEAFIKELLLNLAEPLMLMSPLIGMASAVEVRTKRRKPPATDKADRVGRWAEKPVSGNGAFMGYMFWRGRFSSIYNK